MAQYTGIQGQNILIVSSDPSNPIEGQIWYNTTSNLLKGYGANTVAASWATGGNLNTGRYAISVAATSNSSGLAFGGASTTGSYANSEEYNGTSWTNKPNMNNSTAGRGSAIGATISDVLAISGGQPVISSVENWNGTSWTNNPASVNTARNYGVGAGTNIAALYSGGNDGTYGIKATESYNGTSWTTVADLNNARYDGGGGGTNTSAITFGGYNNGPTAPVGYKEYTETWNGSSWTNGSNMNVTGVETKGTGGPSKAVAVRGPGAVEIWNGSSWTSSPATVPSTAISTMGGPFASGLMAGGYGPPAPYGLAQSFEWTGPGTSLSTKTLTTS